MPGLTCPDCAVPVGQPRHDECDVARCLATGRKRLICDLYTHGEQHDCGQDIWTGRGPGVAECEEYGWYHRSNRGPGRPLPRGSKITVEFTTQGGDTVTAECTSCSSDLDEGDRVRIRYHPDELVFGVEDAENRGSRRVALFALVAVAVLLSAAGFVGSRLARDRSPG